NLTLQKAHATGHAVWLQLREQETKVRCVELIHERRAPYKPDQTYFRGHATQRVYIEKIDRERIEPDAATAPAAGGGSPDRPRKGKISSVTHIMTADATIFDNGTGLDLADVVARGPGWLESRPDLKEPADRIAIWQEQITITNFVGPDDRLQQKKIVLTGSRPTFIDTAQQTKLDSGQTLIVWLEPETPKATATAATATAQPASSQAPAPSNLSGSGLQIKKLHALRDVHLTAPNRKITGRSSLDADFIQAEPAPVLASAAPANAPASAPSEGTAPTPAAPTPAAAAGPAPAPARAPGAGQSQSSTATPVASQDSAPKPEAKPAMTGIADRVWAQVALQPGTRLDSRSRRRSAPASGTTGAAAAPTTTTAAADASDSDEPAAPAQTASGSSSSSQAEIREAWLHGNVALHQDKAPDPAAPATAPKPKGEDITGEAVHLINRGEGKVLAWAYTHDPKDPRRWPGPIPPATVITDEMTIRGLVLRLDQELDKVWCDGPGVLTKWTDRALLTDKSPTPANPQGSATTPAGSDSTAARNGGASPLPGRDGRLVRTSDSDAPANPNPDAATAPPPAPRPRTRGGRPVGDKDLLTITWTQRMEFTGRTKDPLGHPAGRADFFGRVNAQMEDAQLKASEKMIAFTDKEVPLTQLGSLSRNATGAGPSANRPANADVEADADDPSQAQSQADLALIYCYGKSLGVSRKVDPDLPIVIQKQIILAEKQLIYDRRTGKFYVPCAGTVWLYDRSDNSSQTAGPETGRNGQAPRGTTRGGSRPSGGRASSSGRTVTPTSGRINVRSTGAPPATAGGRPSTAAPATPPVTRRIPPLILTQIEFTTGMRGRLGTGQANDTQQTRWSEFFGDIELVRAEVPTDEGSKSVLDPDKPLPPDGFFLTSQILRVIQEPPPAGAPASTPARSFLKAWDNVTVNKAEESGLQCDIATYDSATDQLYAYGEANREVALIQQSGPGQPPSRSSAQAVQYNVKTGTGTSVGSDVVNIFDKKTGARPPHIPPPDPNAKPKKKKKNTKYQIPQTNLERRGFTGF
ncbi:MAG TPA: hypothetical protein VFF52_03250, partial [Isosphaeraceae bacterium]|nr:hypothetical protein [Isosphaeraceae bacterium]